MDTIPVRGVALQHVDFQTALRGRSYRMWQRRTPSEAITEQGAKRIATRWLRSLVTRGAEIVHIEEGYAAPPTAKAPSGPLPAVAIGQNATGTNGPPGGTMFDTAIGGGQSARVPTPDEPEDGVESERKLRAIVGWLEANKPEVFREGLWDALAPVRSEPEGEATDDA